jgi:hypothetical protein
VVPGGLAAIDSTEPVIDREGAEAALAENLR